MHCPYCGFKLQDDFLYCPKCGKTLIIHQKTEPKRVDSSTNKTDNDAPFFKQTWFLLIMLLICFPIGIVLMLLFGKKALKLFAALIITVFLFLFLSFYWEERKSSEEFDVVYSMVSNQSNPSQAAFNKIQERYNSSIQKGKTELEQAEINRKYEAEFNQFLKSRHINNWFARVYQIESVDNGKAAHVVLDCVFPKAKYKIETERFGINKALITSGSPLYKKIISLKSGDYVLLSGKLLNTTYGNGNKVVDLSVSYGDKNKKLIIQFSDITLVKTKE